MSSCPAVTWVGSPGVCGFHTHVVVHLEVDSVLGQGLQNSLHRREKRQVPVCHQTNVPSAEVLEVLEKQEQNPKSVLKHEPAARENRVLTREFGW